MTVDTAILDALRGGLVVSCQPVQGGPLDRPEIAVAMAEAAVQAGANGVRLEGVAAVSAAARSLAVPIIGIVKRDLADYPVRITPLEADVEQLAAAGLAMADCSALEEGLAAAETGFEIVGSTLSGYTGGPVPDAPDFELVERMAAQGLTVMAEGRIRTPAEAAAALSRGAWAVTVGSAITRVEHVTGWFVEAIEAAAP